MERRANPQLGEIELELIMESGGRRKFVLTPKHTAVRDIETALGGGMFQLRRMILSITQEQLAEIFAAGIRAGGRESEWDVTPALLEPGIFRAGREYAIGKAADFLNNCLNGGVSKEFLEKHRLGKEPAPMERPEVSLGANGSESPSESSDGRLGNFGMPRHSSSGPPSSTSSGETSD